VASPLPSQSPTQGTGVGVGVGTGGALGEGVGVGVATAPTFSSPNVMSMAVRVVLAFSGSAGGDPLPL